MPEGRGLEGGRLCRPGCCGQHCPHTFVVGTGQAFHVVEEPSFINVTLQPSKDVMSRGILMSRITKEIMSILKDWDIQWKIASMVTDNGSIFVKALRIHGTQSQVGSRLGQVG